MSQPIDRSRRFLPLLEPAVLRGLIAASLLACTVFVAAPAGASLVPSNGGLTVDDSQGITWLADADLPATQPFSLSPCSTTLTSDCINANGSMDYQAALQWVTGLNSYNGVGYLGHNNWQLPATAGVDPGCTASGAHQEGFAYNCAGSALGSLYYTGLHLPAPSSVVQPAQGTIGGFTNLQPNLYWSGTPQNGSNKAYHTFSFATGWRGSNQAINSSNPTKGVTANFFDVLPMLPAPIDPNISGTVYDPAAKVAWLANGNIAAQNTFGLPICNGIGSTGKPSTPPCVNTDGTMTLRSAKAFIKAMNTMVNSDGKIGYLDQIDWQLPPSTESDACNYAACAAKPAKDPMASLFYNLLKLSAGSSVAGPSTAANGPFTGLQPYLYWSCQASSDQTPAALSPCSSDPQCSPSTQPSPCPNDMEWSFNFGDGFQGTDEEVNDLFVTAYYTDSVAEPPALAVLISGLGLTWVWSRRRRERPVWWGDA